MSKPTNIDEYIQTFPEDVQPVLQQVRETIQKAAPETAEAISYGIPAFKLDGKTLIFFAGAKKHVSIYPYYNEMNDAFPEANAYKQSGKGTIQFPLNKPMPLDLISKIVEFRLQQSREG